MPAIDREKFAFAVAAALEKLGREHGHDGPVPYRAVCRFCPGVTAGTLSRIRSGIEIGAPNYLAVCKGLGLDPLAFLLIDAPTPHSTFARAHAERKTMKTGCSSFCQT